MAEFLLEIGFEEMPAPWLSDLAKQLQAKFNALASDAQLTPSATRVLWTSRRLVLTAEVKPRQDDRTVVEWGPAAKIAKDGSGAWSKAAEGFAKKQGVGLDALILAAKVEGSADLYVSAKKHIAGRASVEVLADLVAPLLRGLNFPKRMNWDAWLDDGRGAFEFGRPIQWILALLDGAVVPFTIFNATGGAQGSARLVSGRRSMGNRFYPRDASDRGFDVKSFQDLDSGLAARFVILDPEKRKARIRTQVEAAGGKLEGEAVHLIDEWCDLVEYPTLAVGSIPKEFADLPREVLETVLAHHQKAITLPAGRDGSPRFAAISGCDEAGAKNAALGQERVVVARLKDARFFWDEDRKRSLESRVEDLATVTFQKGLGSYKDKVLRMADVASSNAASAVLAAGRDSWAIASRALRLSKADLSTTMVREFPELQGRMGGLYARASEPAPIADAIAGHYGVPHPPRSLEDVSGSAATITAAMDKLDTLVGYFRLGAQPSGSADPYGLRRAALGLVRGLLEVEPGLFNIQRVANQLEERYSAQAGGVNGDDRSRTRLGEFLLERLRHVLAERGYDIRVIEAALVAKQRASERRGTDIALDNLPGVEDDVRELAAVWKEHPDVFAALAEAFKRAKNIVGDGNAALVDEGLFVENAERKLYASIQAAEKTPSSDPAARLRAVAALRDDVDAFFKSVMVNAEEPTIRANRHAILRRLLDLVYEIADLSKLASPAGDSAISS